MTKKEKLDEAYADLKAGWTLYYDDSEYWYVTLYYSERDRKEYIYWYCYGSSCESVSKKNFKWVLDEILKVSDYLNYRRA